MRYQVLKKKALLTAAVFTGTAVLYPAMCMASSD